MILNIRLRRASTTSPSISSFSSFSAMMLPFMLGRGESRPPARPRLGSRRLLGDRSDVCRLRTFGAFALLELDARTLGEGLEPLTGDVAVMHEHILRALVRGDEPVPLAVVEPLHGSSCHQKTPPSHHIHEQAGRRW